MATDETHQSPVGADIQDAAGDYIHVRPTSTSIHPNRVSQELRNVHAISATDHGGLFTTQSRPTIEMLLVSPPNSQRVEYLFGIGNASLDGQFPEPLRADQHGDHTTCRAHNRLCVYTDRRRSDTVQRIHNQPRTPPSNSSTTPTRPMRQSGHFITSEPYHSRTSYSISRNSSRTVLVGSLQGITLDRGTSDSRPRSSRPPDPSR